MGGEIRGGPRGKASSLLLSLRGKRVAHSGGRGKGRGIGMLEKRVYRRLEKEVREARGGGGKMTSGRLGEVSSKNFEQRGGGR